MQSSMLGRALSSGAAGRSGRLLAAWPQRQQPPSRAAQPASPMVARMSRGGGSRGVLSSASSSRSSVAARAVQIAEHSVYLEEVAVTQSPKHLAALLRVLSAGGSTPLTPSDRSGLHPLLIPLAADGADADQVVCLLRWPQPTSHKGMSLPVVRMARGGTQVALVARSVDEYLHRLLAEEDAEKRGAGARSLAAAAGPEGEALYKAGDLAASGMGARPAVYVIKKVGMFPDISEELAHGHLAKGDETSSLVTSEWYMRNEHFPGWARPYEFASELLVRIGKREEEARDLARVSLRLPWWSLLHGYGAMKEVAQLEGTPAEVRYNLSDEAQAEAQAKMSNSIRMQGSKDPKTPQEVALDKADELLDMVAAGVEPGYDSVRERLADQYAAAGLTDVANFIRSAT